MDERIAEFIEALKIRLEGLPENEIDNAVNYYEEYLSDAQESGKDLDEVFKELGQPDKIAGMIKAETSVAMARHSPGFRSFVNVMQNAFLGVTTPLAIFLMSVFVLVSYCMVAVFFTGVFASAAGAIAVALGLVYQAFAIPSRYTPEIVGTLGFALLGTSICLLTAYGFYRLGKVFIVLSARVVGRMLKKPGKPSPEIDISQQGKKSNTKRIAFILIGLSAAGLVLASISGLPFKFFVIFILYYFIF